MWVAIFLAMVLVASAFPVLWLVNKWWLLCLWLLCAVIITGYGLSFILGE